MSQSGLFFDHADQKWRIDWRDVYAVRCWRRFNQTSHVAVEIEHKGRLKLLCTWDYSSNAELQQFVVACSAHISGDEDRGAPMASVRFSEASRVRSALGQMAIGMIAFGAVASFRIAAVGAIYPVASALVEFLRFRSITRRYAVKTTSL